MRFRSRAGFSLMEVMVASTMLVGSLIVLNELANLGMRNASDVETYVTAQLLCEQKLNQILTGIDPLEDVESEAFEENEEWFYAVEVEPLEVTGLSSVKVIVKQDEEKFLRPRQYELVRWVDSSTLSNSDTELDSNSSTESGASSLFDDL